MYEVFPFEEATSFPHREYIETEIIPVISKCDCSLESNCALTFVNTQDYHFSSALQLSNYDLGDLFIYFSTLPFLLS